MLSRQKDLIEKSQAVDLAALRRLSIEERRDLLRALTEVSDLYHCEQRFEHERSIPGRPEPEMVIGDRFTNAQGVEYIVYSAQWWHSFQRWGYIGWHVELDRVFHEYHYVKPDHGLLRCTPSPANISVDNPTVAR